MPWDARVLCRIFDPEEARCVAFEVAPIMVLAACMDIAACMCRQLRGPADQIAPMKHALWRELAESGFARLAATIWLLPLLQLLLRVQLNILGRQLFVESNLLEPR